MISNKFLFYSTSAFSPTSKSFVSRRIIYLYVCNRRSNPFVAFVRYSYVVPACFIYNPTVDPPQLFGPKARRFRRLAHLGPFCLSTLPPPIFVCLPLRLYACLCLHLSHSF